MFCTQCGTQLSDQAQFCTGCGTRVGRAPAPQAPAAPIEVIRATPIPTHAAPQREIVDEQDVPMQNAGVCDWCGAPFQAGASSCSRCGAVLKAASIGADSGWVELPGRKDMAKLQFGNSFCQIEGAYVPVADFNLAGQDSVYFAHHVLLWKEQNVNITNMSMKGGWKRLFAGLPLIMTQAQGPGHIAFSQDTPGELVALPVHPGQEVDVKEHLFLVATGNVSYDWFSTGIWYTTQSGDETETHYPLGMFMDRFQAAGTPGLLLLHAAGNVFVRQLGDGETILIKPRALIFKDPSVQMHLHFEDSGSLQNAFSFFSSSMTSRHMWLRLRGPGRVAVQSVFHRHDDIFGNLTGTSGATHRRWY
jgi:uncharacterized protein (AIM24 family)